VSHRTEPPTPRRLREARRRGEIGSSRELTAAGAFAGGLLGLTATAACSTRLFAGALRSALSTGLEPSITAGAATLDALRLLTRVAWAPLGGAIAGALLVGSLQARGLFTLEAIRLRWDRVDPTTFAARALSSARLAGLLLGALKAVALLAVGWRVGIAELRALRDPTRVAPAGLVTGLGRLGLGILIPVAGVLLAFGVVDWMLALQRHRDGLRMTRDEVRREQRDEQGDPQRRAERRRLHRALASAAPVRHAACLVVNPTHVAIALHHDRRCDEAPVVVAKGKGRAAAALRSVARRAGVPIVEDVALARALFRLAEIGDEIPEELYEAAAVVLAELYRTTGRSA
jgi:type III secretion protein U